MSVLLSVVTAAAAANSEALNSNDSVIAKISHFQTFAEKVIITEQGRRRRNATDNTGDCIKKKDPKTGKTQSICPP